MCSVNLLFPACLFTWCLATGPVIPLPMQGIHKYSAIQLLTAVGLLIVALLRNAVWTL